MYFELFSSSWFLGFLKNGKTGKRRKNSKKFDNLLMLIKSGLCVALDMCSTQHGNNNKVSQRVRYGLLLLVQATTGSNYLILSQPSP